MEDGKLPLDGSEVKSTRSAEGNSCAWARRTAEGVAMRDEHGGEVRYSPEEWQAFLEGVRDGGFNL